MRVRDQLQRTLEFSAIPERIVSLVPSQTELLVDLGLESKIVGVTKFCVHPAHLRANKIIVGGTKNVNFNKIAELCPDIIICNKEENTKDMVVALEKLAPVWVSDIYSVSDAIHMIEDLGALFRVDEVALRLVTTILKERKAFENSVKNHPRKKVAYVIWKNPWMLAGKNTFIENMLALNNLDNIVTGTTSRYPDVTSKTLKEAEIVYLSTEPYPFSETDVRELKKALRVEVRLVDGEYFSWYGSRLTKAFTYFKTLH